MITTIIDICFLIAYAIIGVLEFRKKGFRSAWLWIASIITFAMVLKVTVDIYSIIKK